ncbi:uncharacterized protein [Aegilops tauschii subsp. strangulata]|nr:putative F-box/LRR-repeat protein At5g02700 [Aegilops tauschii subsp. strangulata]XP_044377659.1 putative F-box/LRR-repeat protein At5g02700 [Triticum aestivum]
MEETENGPRHGCPGPADLISALPDDLLLQVLERLGAAARTSVLSRRWRGLWTRLPHVTIALHDVPFRSIQAALARAVRPGVCHYRLDIRVRWQATPLRTASVSSLLLAAAALSPVEVLFVLSPDVLLPRLDRLPVEQFYALLPWSARSPLVGVDLPRFRRATSIDLRARHLRLFAPPSGFPSLERLALTGCDVDLAALIPRCPRIRALRVNNNGVLPMDSITVHSPCCGSSLWRAATHGQAVSMSRRPCSSN